MCRAATGAVAGYRQPPFGDIGVAASNRRLAKRLGVPAIVEGARTLPGPTAARGTDPAIGSNHIRIVIRVDDRYPCTVNRNAMRPIASRESIPRGA